ncbi:MAG: hypothetical protein INH41_25695 [Myxococcaceae bacterium]|nr:hypothetical protein [Myxococcaceae bacterium]
MRLVAVGVLVLVTLAGCAGGLRAGWFAKDGLRYQVAAPPEGEWRPVAFAENDLAWAARRSGHLLAVNATCKDHGDPSLEVLTGHLLIGFQERALVERQPLTLDGRAALKSLFAVSLDGVPAEVEVVVLKKNGCVHDFTYVAPRGARAVHQAAFEALVAGFAQETGR